MSNKVDQEILELYSNGKQQESFKLLLNTYQERTYWHIRRILLSHEDTNDVLQNTLIKVWKGLEGFQGNSRLYTWIFRIASNETFTFLEKNKKHLSEVDIENCYHFASDDDGKLLSGDIIQKKLEEAILTLPEKQRMVFHLKYFEEMKYEQISEVLGTSIGALKANYHLAVKKIENFLLND
ncbi:MAG: RNA polymerase sigma factor [Flavobacteriales bacterium]|nr:RNA polymerase sigma factor [Flavobacteriales bacterium]